MKTKSNIALEGTCNGDVVGGLLLWAVGKPSGAFVFGPLRDRRLDVLMLPSSKPQAQAESAWPGTQKTPGENQAPRVCARDLPPLLLNIYASISKNRLKIKWNFNDTQDEVGFVLDMALKSLGRMSGRLHLLAQIQVTTQAVKAIYYQEGY